MLAAIGLLAAVTGCAPRQPGTCAPGTGSPMAVFTLFLGESIAGRDPLTEQEWLSFLDTTVTANLPNGYTVFDANGGWMNPVTRKTIQEGTKVLLVALPEIPDSLGAVNRIRAAYQLRFHQQLVGMTVETACGTF